MAPLEKSSTVEAKGDLLTVQHLYEDPRKFRKDVIFFAAIHSKHEIGQQTEATRLAGTWSLVSWYNVSDDGKAMPQPVDGTDPRGILIFDSHGHFSLVIATDRPKWKSPDRMEGTGEENKLAARGTLAYAANRARA
jgi:lipocalin-like protein